MHIKFKYICDALDKMGVTMLQQKKSLQGNIFEVSWNLLHLKYTAYKTYTTFINILLTTFRGLFKTFIIAVSEPNMIRHKINSIVAILIQ